jgi:hypothetical protein
VKVVAMTPPKRAPWKSKAGDVSQKKWASTPRFGGELDRRMDGCVR